MASIASRACHAVIVTVESLARSHDSVVSWREARKVINSLKYQECLKNSGKYTKD